MSIPKLFERGGVTPKFLGRQTPPAPTAVAHSHAPVVWLILCAYLKRPWLSSVTGDFAARISHRSAPSQIAATVDRLEPIYRLMCKRLQNAPYLQTVEISTGGTGVSSKKTQRWLRVISRLGDDLVFDSRSSRRRGYSSDVLVGFHGYLHVTGMDRSRSLVRRYPHLIPVGCWTECRSRIFKTHAEWPKAVDVILRIIDWLEACESHADTHALSAPDRRRLRQNARRPLFWLKRVAVGLCQKLPSSSSLRAACIDLLRSWEPLTRHFETGVTRLDHTLAEDAIRLEMIASAAGLPRGNRTADRRAAIVYSLVFSCLRRGVQPSSYLLDVLSRLPAKPTKAELDALTPARWRAARATANIEHPTSNAQLPTPYRRGG